MLIAVGSRSLGSSTLLDPGLPGYLDLALTLTNPPSSDPGSRVPARRSSATLYIGILLLLFVVPIGVVHGDLPRGVRGQDALVQRLLEINIQNLAAVPSIVYGILGLAFFVRGLGLGRVLLAGAMILTLLVLPTVIIAAREAIRAVPDSIRQGALRARRDAVAGGLAAGAAGGDPRHRDRLDPGALARDRRDGAADHDRRGHLHLLRSDHPGAVHRPADPDLQLPGLPQAEFKLLAAASIIVLLAILLTLNAFAIFIRNRYRRTW